MVTFISSFVFAGVLSAYMFLGRGLSRQLNEQGLESRARLALYTLTQDVSSASAIATQNPGATTTGYLMSLTVPGLGTVNYASDWSLGSTNGQLKRVVGGTTLVLLKNLSSLNFAYYDVSGNSVTAPSTGSPTSVPSTQQINIKQVCMYYTATAGVASTGNLTNFTVASPMIIMKNKGFLTDPTNP